MKVPVNILVNGKQQTITTSPDTPLLYILRNTLNLNGPKFGCGLEQCGACMVHINGECGPSCRVPIGELEGKEIKTIEHLAKENGQLHPVQQAFIEEQEKQFQAKVQEAVEQRLAQESTASVETPVASTETAKSEDTVEDVVESVEVPHSSIANNNEASSVEETLEDKFKSAFSAQNISITY